MDKRNAALSKNMTFYAWTLLTLSVKNGVCTHCFLEKKKKERLLHNNSYVTWQSHVKALSLYNSPAKATICDVAVVCRKLYNAFY